MNERGFLKCKMCEGLQPFRKGRKPLARVGCGEPGSVPSSGSPGAPSTAGGSIPTRPWVLPWGRTWSPRASALSHAALCSTVVRGGPGARAQLVSQLCHRSVSQDESESLWAEASPCGVTALPLPALPPSGCLEQAHPHPWDTQSGPATLLPAQGSPAGARPVAGGGRDPAPLFLSAAGEMS